MFSDHESSGRASREGILNDPNLQKSLDLDELEDTHYATGESQSTITIIDETGKKEPKEHVEVAIEVQKKGASFGSSVFNLVNTTIGAGVLSLASSFLDIGILFGIIFTLLFAFFCWYSIWCLARTAERAIEIELKKNKQMSENEFVVDFKWVAKRTIPWTGYFNNVFIFCFAVGITIAYLIVVGDAFPTIISMNAKSYTAESWYKVLTNRQFWIGIVWLLNLSLIFKKKLDSIRFASYIAFPCMCYLAGFLFVTMCIDGPADGLHFLPTSASGLKCITVFAFAYACHLNYYTVFNEFAPSDRNRYASKGGIVASGIVCFIYLIAGLCGYIVCGPATAGNVINSLPNNAGAIIGRIAVGICVAFSYPLMFNPARYSLLSLLKSFKFFKFMNKKTAMIVHIVLTVVIAGVSLIALAIKDVDIVLGFLGCLACPVSGFVMPGFYYWSIFRKDPSTKQKVLSSIAFLYGIFGIFLMVVGFVLQIHDLTK